jgi:hypothetical protein
MASTEMSSATAVANSPPTGNVGVIGAASVGSVLSAGIGFSDPDGIGALSYLWQSSTDALTWTDITGATSPGLTLTQAHLGLRIRVRVSYVDGQGNAETLFSNATVEVGGPNSRPSGGIAIIGTVAEKSTLTLTSTLADADGMGPVAYRWQSSADGQAWQDIPGATDTSYTLVQREVGKFIRVTASYTDAKGALESVTSAVTARTANVNDPPTGTVTISGTVTLNGLLTIQHNLADADGLGSLRYRWQSSADGITWNDIADASSLSFSPPTSVFGLRLRALVEYTDAEGTPESVPSAATEPVGNVNSAPQGTLSVTGQPLEGVQLQVQNSIFDADGVVGAFAYRWQMSADGADWVDIAGATGETFMPGQAQVGQLLRVVANYVDGRGKAESVISAATAAIVNVNAPPTGSITIVGSARQNSTLSLQNNLGDADGLGPLNYRWQSSTDQGWDDIDGATAATFTPAQAQVGRMVRVVVSYVDGGGTRESVASPPTAAVQNVNDLPTGSVTVSGTPKRGESITAVSTLADADGLGTLSYRWQVAEGFLNWTDIPGADAVSYVPTLDQVGKLLRVVVSYVDGQGTRETVLSAATSAVQSGNSPPTGQLVIAGSVKQGGTLTASAALSDADGLGAFTWSWQQSTDGSQWRTIEGAAGTRYIPGPEQVGQLLRASVSYVDGKGQAETFSSAPTTAVMGVLRGTAAADTLNGTDAAEEIQGYQGNDQLRGNGGNDTLVGGDGIDKALYALSRASYQVGPGGTSVRALAGSEGDDVLLQVERIRFADVGLAFDLQGHAGVVARLLGAVFGREAVSQANYVRIGLEALDGGMSELALAQLALDARLGPGFAAGDVIRLLYQNLLGVAPSGDELGYWQGQIGSGQYSPASLALMAAQLEINAENIDLVGLAAQGLPYG